MLHLKRPHLNPHITSAACSINMSLIGLRRAFQFLFHQNLKSSFFSPIYSLPLFTLEGCKNPKADMTEKQRVYVECNMLFYLLPTWEKRQERVCIHECGSVRECVQYVYPLVPALPFWPAQPQQLFSALGYIPGESPEAEQLPGAPLLTPFFTRFPLAGPLSLTAHAITR